MNYNTNTNKFYAVICCIVKDEGYDLIHWVNYHFAIGFDKIYIFDNNSKISIKTTLADYMRCGIIEVQDITLNEFPQLSAYAAFLKKFGEDARWVAFIDADEYINIKSKTDISEFLEEYETYPAVGISWKVFGSNGNIKRPSLGPDKAYTTCLKEHSLIKSIIQPAMTEDVISPHHFIYKNNTFCVNEHCIPIIGPRSYHTSEKIQINHYYYKSQQDFENKISRGLATPMQNKLCYKLEEFYEQSRKQGELEKSIQRFSKKTDFYSKMGAKFISDEILDKISVNVQELLKEIATNLIQKKESKIIKKIKRALKYDPNPLLYIALAKIYALQGDYSLTFNAFAEALSVTRDNQSREHIFRELSSFYERIGLSKQSEHILRELEANNK